LVLGLFLDASDARAAPPQSPDAACVVHGRVIDVTGQPLVGVTVSVPPDTVVVTDQDGHYCLASSAPRVGRITVTVSLSGFRTETRDLNVPPDGTTLDVTLQPAVSSEVVVTATGVPRPIEDIAVRTEVLPSVTIAKTAARTFSDAIQYQTGLRVDVTCQNCNAGQVQMLGLEQRYTSILVDGHPVLSGLASIYGIDQIPTALIDHIEVVKGGGSALYGPGAVAGAINIISKDPVTTGGSLELNYEHINRQEHGYDVPPVGNAVLNFANHTQTFGATVYGVRGYVSPTDPDHDGFTEVSKRDLWTGGTRLVYKPTEHATLRADYSASVEDRRGGSDDLTVSPSESAIAEWIHSLHHVASVTFDQTVSPRLDYSTSLTFSRAARDYYYGGTGAYGSPNPVSPFFSPDAHPDLGYGDTGDNLYLVNSAVNLRPAHGHIVTLGVAYRNEHIVNTQNALATGLEGTTVEPAPLRYVYGDVGVLAQHDWTFSSRWNVVYGMRIDKHDLIDHPIVSPRLAIKYAPTTAFRLRGSMSTGFIAPELYDEDFDSPLAGDQVRRIAIASALKPEKSLGFSLAPEWEIQSGLRLEGNLFYTRLTDTFRETQTDDPQTASILEITKVNSGRSGIYGAELNLDLDFEAVQIDLGYVEQRARYQTAQVVAGPDVFDPAVPEDNQIYSRDIPRSPQRYGVAKVTADAPWFEAFAAGKFTGPMDVPHLVSDETTGDLVRNDLTRSPYFFDMDLGLSKKWIVSHARLLTASAGIRNVLNAYQHDFDRGAYRDSNYIYGPRMPRNFYVGLKCEF
jgi:outer membrane receptor for ferrienterochelin and colicins